MTKISTLPVAGGLVRRCFIFIGIGLFGLFPLKGVSDWLSGGPMPSVLTFFALVALVILPILILAILVLDLLRISGMVIIARTTIMAMFLIGATWEAQAQNPNLVNFSFADTHVVVDRALVQNHREDWKTKSSIAVEPG